MAKITEKDFLVLLFAMSLTFFNEFYIFIIMMNLDNRYPYLESQIPIIVNLENGSSSCGRLLCSKLHVSPSEIIILASPIN